MVECKFHAITVVYIDVNVKNARMISGWSVLDAKKLRSNRVVHLSSSRIARTMSLM